MGAETVALSRLVVDVYAAGRGEFAWDALARRMARVSRARSLSILRGARPVARFGEPTPPDPEAARRLGYHVTSHASRAGSPTSWLLQRFAPAIDAGPSLAPLLTHVTRALDLKEREDRFGHLHRGLARTLADRMPVAVFEIEPDFRVRSLNGPARELAAAGDRIWLRRGILGFEAEGTRAQLRRRMVAGDVRHVTSIEATPGSGALALCLRKIESGAWWLLALDPARPPQPSLAELRRRYGLTDREGRLALEIVCGASIPATAQRLGVSQGTLRSQLKSIFRKTGSHSQSELVIRLCDDPAWLLESESESEEASRD